MGRGKAGGAAVAAGRKASEAGTKSRKAAEEKGAGVTEGGEADFLKKSKASVQLFSPHMDADERSEMKGIIKAVLGKKGTEENLASLAGAPDNATVRIEAGVEYLAANDQSVTIRVNSDELSSTRTIYRTRGTNKLVIHNEIFELKHGVPQGTGIGAKVLARQVEQAAKLGVDEIRTTAARSSYFNGYYTWARLGYDAPLPDHIRGILPGKLSGSTRVRDLMHSPQGREFWKTHGETIDMTFDLSPGSYSRKALSAYLKERGFVK